MIKVLYLVSGHTIMAQQVQNETGVTLKRPVRVELVPSQTGISVEALPIGGVFGMFGSEEVSISSNHIITERAATKQEEDFWLAQTSSIQLAK